MVQTHEKYLGRLLPKYLEEAQQYENYELLSQEVFKAMFNKAVEESQANLEIMLDTELKSVKNEIEYLENQ